MKGFSTLLLSLSFSAIHVTTPSIKAFLALVPASILLVGSVVLFLREKTFACFLQLIGAACLIVVVLAHVFEAFRLFPSMHWGETHSVGHYLDFWSAVLGLSVFPTGYLLHSLTKSGAEPEPVYGFGLGPE